MAVLPTLEMLPGLRVHEMTTHFISFWVTWWSCWIVPTLQAGTRHVLGVSIGILPGERTYKELLDNTIRTGKES